MKKFLAIIAIAAFAVACNNSSEEKTPAEDTTTNMAPATQDTMAPATMDTMAPAAMDTTTKM